MSTCVYLVYRDDNVVAVCSSEKNAKLFIPRNYRKAYRIEARYLDEGVGRAPAGMKFYLIYFNAYGRVVEASILPATHWSEEVWLPFSPDLEIRVWAESKDAAILRAKEKREWVYSRAREGSDVWDDLRSLVS